MTSDIHAVYLTNAQAAFIHEQMARAAEEFDLRAGESLNAIDEADIETYNASFASAMEALAIGVRAVHVLTEHYGADQIEVLGVFTDRDAAFGALNERYDKRWDDDYHIEPIGELGRVGFLFASGHYHDIEIILALDIPVTTGQES